MTIIEVPENYRWVITREVDPYEWSLDARGAWYFLSYQRKFSRIKKVRVKGKHWWSRLKVVKELHHDPENDWNTLSKSRLPVTFDEKIIREHAWDMLHQLALREPDCSLDRFIGTYPPKTLD